MKVFISQVSDGIAIIKAKDKEKASEVLGVPKHQFIWEETTNATFVNIAEINNLVILNQKDLLIKAKQKKQQI